MSDRVDLIWRGDDAPLWSLGNVHCVDPRESSAVAWRTAVTAGADALVWDSCLGRPSEDSVVAARSSRGDVWHAGLLLGTEGHPAALDAINPAWILGIDPPTSVAATSWRLTLRACLVSAEVLAHMPGPDARFDTDTAADLDLGLRLLDAGAVPRHEPTLVDAAKAIVVTPPSLADELLIVRRRMGPTWAAYAAWRRAMWDGTPLAAMSALRKHRGQGRVHLAALPDRTTPALAIRPTVTALVPTLDRYPYLESELHQLQPQTLPLSQVVVVDQTPPTRRRSVDGRGLPVTYIPQDALGQATAWNAAIEASTSDLLLFLGDDADDIVPSFVEDLARRLVASRADVVAARVEEVGAARPPDVGAAVRVADTFPICLVRREAFERSGLYDLAFDQGARADKDVAVRMLMTGSVLLYDSSIRIVHLRAPVGGLRAHGARKVTSASARRSLIERNIPSITELYGNGRHLTARQQREARLLAVLETFRGTGSRRRQAAKAIVSAALLPSTLRRLRANERAAAALLSKPAAIPQLSPR